MWHKYCSSILGKPNFQTIPGNQCGPIKKKTNHDIRNNLEKVISFCSIIKYHLTVETGSIFHTPSKVIFQLNVSFFHSYWHLFLRHSNS